ncbi:MAG: flagellar export chaperone FlgN [Pseudomonadota bacterium]
MEIFAYEMETFLEKKLQAYQRLAEILKKDRESVFNMDIDAIWASSRHKNEIASQLKQIRRQIMDCVESTDIRHAMDPATFSLKQMMETLPLPPRVRFRFEKIILAINEAKSEVIRLARENRNYVNEYVDTINGIMSSITAGPRSSTYTQAATVIRMRNSQSLIRAEV